MKRTGIIDIKDILRHCHDLGLPRARIAAAVGVSAGTVSHVLDRASTAGLSWPLPGDLDDKALRERLYPRRSVSNSRADQQVRISLLRQPVSSKRGMTSACRARDGLARA